MAKLPAHKLRNIVAADSAVKEAIETIAGLRGDPDSRMLSVGDLKNPQIFSEIKKLVTAVAGPAGPMGPQGPAGGLDTATFLPVIALTNVTASAAFNTILVSWSGLNMEYGVSRYEIQKRVVGTGWPTTWAYTSPSTSKTFSTADGLTTTDTYEFRVRAVAINGDLGPTDANCVSNPVKLLNPQYLDPNPLAVTDATILNLNAGGVIADAVRAGAFIQSGLVISPRINYGEITYNTTTKQYDLINETAKTPGALFAVSEDGHLWAENATFKGITIQDSFGNVVMSSTGNIPLSKVTGAGTLAGLNSVSVGSGQVTGLGALATQNTVTTGQVSGLRAMALIDMITTGNIGTYIQLLAVDTAFIAGSAVTSVARSTHADLVINSSSNFYTTNHTFTQDWYSTRYFQVNFVMDNGNSDTDWQAKFYIEIRNGSTVLSVPVNTDNESYSGSGKEGVTAWDGGVTPVCFAFSLSGLPLATALTCRLACNTTAGHSPGGNTRLREIYMSSQEFKR
jgi:hypothetical protein